ncbi:MAG: NAD(P)-dependent malic enzyme [Elusimicrobiota bacterium]
MRKSDNETEKKYFQQSLRLHKKYRGKIGTTLKCPVRNYKDFALWYTPGVAAPCEEIKKSKEKVYQYTSKGNTVAVVSDGSRVLGLGDIGPQAALPVMEGKALLYKYLGGVDAYPVCVNVDNPEEIVGLVEAIQPSFGGINLEDISSPECFEVLKRLRKSCNIPVWHDDQQGTAAVTLAGLINALKLTDRQIEDVKIAMVGAGASNIRIANLIIEYGADPEKILMCDSKGILSEHRKELKTDNPSKWDMAKKTNPENIGGKIPDAMENADVLIALSRPGPDVIKKEWIEQMAPGPVVFACANPTPEIWPSKAKAAGAEIVATGRSDFPNQVNNSLGFPGIFRGALDVRAKTITDKMCIKAAESLAGFAGEEGLSADYIIPTMEQIEVFAREAAAVGMQAVKEGVARKTDVTRSQLEKKALKKINKARREVQVLMDEKIID